MRTEAKSASRMFHEHVNQESAALAWSVTHDPLYRLADVDELHEGESLIEWGWLFLHGTNRSGTKIWLPLLSSKATIESRWYGRNHISLVDDPSLPVDVFTPEQAEELEADIDRVVAPLLRPVHPYSAAVVQHAPLVAWVRKVARMLDMERPVVLAPEAKLDKGPSSVSTAMALYLARDVNASHNNASLLRWAGKDVSQTALGAMFSDQAHSTEAEPHVTTPFPINAGQREAIARSTHEPVTLVSGPPGTGKSHCIAAMAVTAVAKGQSVLVATQSPYGTDVIADLLDRHPGPRFVQFGRWDQRNAVARELADGVTTPLSPSQFEDIKVAVTDALGSYREVKQTLLESLAREQALDQALDRRVRLAATAPLLPATEAADFDLDKALQLAERAAAGGWLAGRATKKLQSMLDHDAPLETLRKALDTATNERTIRAAIEGGGLSTQALWLQLEHADKRRRDAVGQLIEAERRNALVDRSANTTITALATALRSGRQARRRALRDIADNSFLDVLPLWLGTLSEIDDTLPEQPGMFDLVIFDEASQIDLARAASTLCRARRVVIVGDPRQLRHVSFTSDEIQRTAAANYEIAGEEASLLDIRRNSLFDVGTATTTVTMLNEHFRSLPHIIEFSAERFYDGHLRLMTQHPQTETLDCVDYVVVDGKRDSSGVNQTEVETVRNRVVAFMEKGAPSIGVMSPFRDQADALEEMLLSEFTHEQRRDHRMRVGTVHAFQGNERDAVIISLALGSDDIGRSLRFVEDEHLFNVMVTRAKHCNELVTSIPLEELPKGLLADYLRWSEAPLDHSKTGVTPYGWVKSVADGLATYGVPIVAEYPVAGWTIDLVVGDGNRAVGVEARVHPEGPAKHIERHQALRRAGWHIVDVFQSRWLANPEAAADAVITEVMQA